MTRNFLMMVALLGILSCHSKQPAAGTVAPPAKRNLKGLSFALQKDPACAMPLHAGLEDTVSYKGKLYGFCSKECKEAFLKNPSSYLATTK